MWGFMVFIGLMLLGEEMKGNETGWRCSTHGITETQAALCGKT
jgi:hypothetical protein